MEIQFSSHAVERVCGRMSNVVSYGEVQSVLSHKELRPGFFRVLIKKLTHSVVIEDDTAFNGQVKGDKIFALVHSTKDGVTVDTIALSN